MICIILPAFWTSVQSQIVNFFRHYYCHVQDSGADGGQRGGRSAEVSKDGTEKGSLSGFEIPW